MTSLTDQQLLRDYLNHQTEAAFAELVRRYIDLVYSAALRMVCDSHLAEDVAQGVFVALAKNAGQLTDHPVLSGWLHRTAQNIAAQTVHTNVRREAREQEAFAMNELLSAGSDADWKHIAPHLDAALGELSEPDRDALLLRYFERKSAREIAQVFGVSDDAAQKRVNRAVDRLRELFSKNGIAVGASGLVVAISSHSVQAAPPGLAATISTAATLAGKIITTATVSTAKAITMTTLQKTLLTLIIAAAVGTSIYETRQVSAARAEVQRLQQQQTEQAQRSQNEKADAASRLSTLADAIERSKGDPSELLKLRAEVTRLRNDANSPVNKDAKAWQGRIQQLKKYLEQHPEAAIPEFVFLTDQNWTYATSGKLDSETDYRRAIAQLREASELTFGYQMQLAMGKYLAANNEKSPTDLSQLRPYLDSPVNDAMLQRWEILPAKDVPNMKDSGGDWVITQKAAVDEEYDSRVRLCAQGLSTGGSQGFVDDALYPIFKSYLSAHNGQPPEDPSTLLPFASTPQQKAQLEKAITRFNTFSPAQKAQAQSGAVKYMKEIWAGTK